MPIAGKRFAQQRLELEPTDGDYVVRHLNDSTDTLGPRRLGAFNFEFLMVLHA